MSSVKVDQDIVESVLRQQEIEQEKIISVMEALREHLEAQAEEPKPRIKRQLSVLVSDPDGKLAETEIVAWVVSVPEEDNPLDVPHRIARAAREFNLTPKGKRVPVKTVGEALEAVPAKFFKSQDNMQVKTKEPVLVVRTDNELVPVGEVE